MKERYYVVIDGNFVCVDPYLGTTYHLLSDVKLSKLETLISKYPNFYSFKKRYLNKGIIKNKKISRFKAFISNSSKYLPFLQKAKYIGSMFVVRALKINKENTDERVTSINYHNKKIISVFSGKWNNCIYLAKKFKFEKMKKNVGLIGKGKWGSLIKSKLSKLAHLKFVLGKNKNFVNFIKKNDLDWVFIATPNSTHYQIVKKCLELKINVFCEKPLSTNLNEAKQLFRIAKKNKVKLYVSDIYSFQKKKN